MPPINITWAEYTPLAGRVHNTQKDGISAIRVGMAQLRSLDERVSEALDLILAPKLYERGKATPLDLLSSDGLSKTAAAEIRNKLLAPGELAYALRDRYHSLLVRRSPFVWLDNAEHKISIPGRRESEKALLYMLNEIYQLSCLGLIKDGFFLRPEQLNRVFLSADEFDSFVTSASIEWMENASRSKEGKEWVRPRSAHAALVSCLILRNMLNVHDSLLSEKFYKASQDTDTLLEKFQQFTNVFEPLREEGAYRIEVGGTEWFSGTLYVDEKTFDSINLKKWSNRKYGNADAMDDIVRIRFEGKRGDRENISRAVNWIAKVIFSGKVVLEEKGELLDHSLIPKRKNLVRRPSAPKSATSVNLRNADVTGVVELTRKGVSVRTTGTFECQFQYEGEMEEGWEHPAIYDLKKRLTDGARKLGSLDIYNILFYIRQLPFDELTLDGHPMTENDVIRKFFNLDDIEQNAPTAERFKRMMKWVSNMKVQANAHTIEKIWGKNAGFFLPVRVGSGVRFLTRESFSADVFRIYPGMFTPAPLVRESGKYLSKMIEQADLVVQIRLEDYRKLMKRYNEGREALLGEYKKDQSKKPSKTAE